MLLEALLDERGQNLIEYGLIAGFISIAGLAALKFIGPKLVESFQTIADAMGK